MVRRRTNTTLFFVVFCSVLLVAVVMIRPLIPLILFAAILAIALAPLQQLLLKRIRYPSAAATVSTLILLVGFLIPMILVLRQIAIEVTGLYTLGVSLISTDAIDTLTGYLRNFIGTTLPDAGLDAREFSQQVQNIIGWVANQFGRLFTGAIRLVFYLLLVLLVFFYLIRDGGRVVARLTRLSPLDASSERHVIGTLKGAIHAMMYSTLILALVQGLTAGAAALVFNAPNPALLGGIVMLVAFIPGIGPPAIMLPFSVYLWLKGQTIDALGLAFVSIFVCTILIDYFVRPHLVSGTTSLHPLAALLGLIGGIMLWGPLGLVLGPVMMALVFAFFDVYESLMSTAAAKEK